MTKNEALYYYRRSQSAYEKAEAEYKRANDRANYYRDVRAGVQNEISAASSRKKNLEKRLEEVIQILGFFGGTVTQNIDAANRQSAGTDEAYRAAIRCSEVAANSIHAAFKLGGVTEEACASSAYSSCEAEKRRLERDIETLRVELNRLENRVAELSSSISGFADAAEGFSREMNRSRALAESYAQQYRRAAN